MTHIVRPIPFDPAKAVPKIHPAQTSARSETAVVVDLLSMGLEVFQQVGAHGVVDLLALNRHLSSRPLGIEVKTGICAIRANPDLVALRPLRGVQLWWPDIVAIVDPRDLAVFYVDTRDVRAEGKCLPLVNPLHFIDEPVPGSEQDPDFAESIPKAHVWAVGG